MNASRTLRGSAQPSFDEVKPVLTMLWRRLRPLLPAVLIGLLVAVGLWLCPAFLVSTNFHPWYNCSGISIKMSSEKQAMKRDQPDQSEPFPRGRIPPEILEWARQTFDEEDFLAQVREIEATGGVALEDFIAELEARARSK
jgi:hypothetical protein